MARRSISIRLRFEVFKRDGFRCVYCGAHPEVSQLRIDHVNPVASGGTNEPGNLATACDDCNSGKWATPLSSLRLPRVRTYAEGGCAVAIQPEQLDFIRRALAVGASMVDVMDIISEAFRFKPVDETTYDETTGEFTLRMNELIREVEELTAAEDEEAA